MGTGGLHHTKIAEPNKDNKRQACDMPLQRRRQHRTLTSKSKTQTAYLQAATGEERGGSIRQRFEFESMPYLSLQMFLSCSKHAARLYRSQLLWAICLGYPRSEARGSNFSNRYIGRYFCCPGPSANPYTISDDGAGITTWNFGSLYDRNTGNRRVVNRALNPSGPVL